MTSDRPAPPSRRRSGVGRLVVAAALASLAVLAAAPALAQSSSGSSLTAAQRKDLQAVAAAYEKAEATVIRAFAPKTAVPRNVKWHRASLTAQKRLVALSGALPNGPCRSAVDDLLAHERSRNPLRLQVIDDFRAEDLGLVASDTVTYALTTPRLYDLRDGVLSACGAAPDDASRTAAFNPNRPELTAAQTEKFVATQEAYGRVATTYAKVFSLPEYVADSEALERANVPVTAGLTKAVADLPDGACRASLQTLLDLQQRESALRQASIAAGKANDLTAVVLGLGEYAKINASSQTSFEAHTAATRACGVKI